MESGPEGPMNHTWRCHQCDDVIGVYEPMVVLDNEQARLTSRAGEQGRGPPVADCYHEACYSLAEGGLAPV
jgi:hypothetical protein